jgi:signal transduction histidine kinase
MYYYQNSRGELKYEELALEKIIYKSLDSLKYMKGFEVVEKQVEIQQDIALHSDQYRWSVIILNLLSNSIKYRDVQKQNMVVNILVTINQQQAILRVEDNGIGIQAELVPKIFDMFYRATEKSQGAGLGLFIVKEMVEKLKGQIRVETEYGKGTTMTITVPNVVCLIKGVRD